jgi:hypothetical protein
MLDYIEREEALRAFNPDEQRIDPIDARGRIVNVPAAKVAPVREGRWLEYNDPPYSPIIQCNLPDCAHVPTDRTKSKYCPNCGAKMKEKAK